MRSQPCGAGIVRRIRRFGKERKRRVESVVGRRWRLAEPAGTDNLAEMSAASSTWKPGWRRFFPIWLALAAWTMGADETPWRRVLREGDVVFSGSKVGQGEAIAAATGSEFTHCGIVFLRDGRLMVLEAVQPVRVVPLETFMGAARPAVFAARRLRTPPAPAALATARNWAAAQVGKDYDARFGWGDDRLYCSELVWKAFAKAGVELCRPKAFRDFNLNHPKVRELLLARFGAMDRVPLGETVVAPSDLAASALMEKIEPPAP